MSATRITRFGMAATLVKELKVRGEERGRWSVLDRR
jgi:hypothetical protein